MEKFLFKDVKNININLIIKSIEKKKSSRYNYKITKFISQDQNKLLDFINELINKKLFYKEILNLIFKTNKELYEKYKVGFKKNIRNPKMKKNRSEIKNFRKQIKNENIIRYSNEKKIKNNYKKMVDKIYSEIHRQ